MVDVSGESAILKMLFMSKIMHALSTEPQRISCGQWPLLAANMFLKGIYMKYNSFLRC